MHCLGSPSGSCILYYVRTLHFIIYVCALTGPPSPCAVDGFPHPSLWHYYCSVLINVSLWFPLSGTKDQWGVFWLYLWMASWPPVMYSCFYAIMFVVLFFECIPGNFTAKLCSLMVIGSHFSFSCDVWIVKMIPRSLYGYPSSESIL